MDHQIFSENFRTPASASRRNHTRIKWKQVLAITKGIVLVLLVVTFVAVFVDKLLKPIRLYTREYRATQLLASEVSNLKKENAELANQIRYLQTSKGASVAARKLGYVKKGEVTIILPEETVVSKSTKAAALLGRR